MSHCATRIVLMAPIKPPALKLTAAVMAAALNHKTQQLNPSIAINAMIDRIKQVLRMDEVGDGAGDDRDP